jgi:hypothetical protein
MSDETGKAAEHLPVPAEPARPSSEGRQNDLFPGTLLQQALDVERQRIDSANRRTDVALQAVKASDESDRRQFEFQMEKLHSDDRASIRRDGLAKVVVVGLGIFGVGVVVLFLVMAFFGSPTQSQIALDILGKLAIGGGGYGVIAGLVNFTRRLLRNPGAP